MVSADVLEQATRRLVERFHPQRIILFGSQARGTADERSDVDLLVICPIQGRRRDLWLEMERSLRGLRLPRDIVLLSPEQFEEDKEIPGTIARPAWLEGKVLYDSAA